MSRQREIELHEAVEADLDRNYHSISIAHPNKAITTWYLLTALEDTLRGLLTRTADADSSIVGLHLDRQKYSARFALARIREECTDTSNVALPTRVVPKLYLKTVDLLLAGFDYMAASQLCSAAHVGTLKFVESDETIDIVVNKAKHDKRYAALELLGYFPPGLVDHTTNLYAWARWQERRPPVVDAIAQSVRVKGETIVYEYDPSLAFALAQKMMQTPQMIPEGWSFRWGGRAETQLLINALCIRCMYHWVAVEFGARLHGLRGGGEASLLYVTTKAELILDLREMCSLSESSIRSFVQYLTYGFSMNTPDPALQPIIPLRDGVVGIPCLLFLSSNYDRNLLSLQARIDSSRFDGMSKLFEDCMVRELLEVVLPRWPLTKDNITIRAGKEHEEIDLLIADPESQTLLVCELRWMLQPGDPREVNNRKKVCWEKVDQLARKVSWLRLRKGAALSSFDFDIVDVEKWQVEGVVVIKTFGGALSKKPEFPIMTARGFAQGIEHCRSLRHFAVWSQSLNWLPKEDTHFRMVHQEMHLSVLSKRLVAHGIEGMCSPYKYENFVKQSLAHSVP